MSSFNRITLAGNLGADPEVRSTTGGQRVASFSLATSERWTDDKGKHERTAWHRIVAWGALADVIEKYLHKGDKALVDGKLTYRKWKDKNDNDRETAEVTAKDVVFLSSKREAKPATAAATSTAANGEFDDFPSQPPDDDEPPF